MGIFDGEYSRYMWEEINSAKTVEDLRDALYLVCCRMQELETKLASASPNKEVANGQELETKLASASPNKEVANGQETEWF